MITRPIHFKILLHSKALPPPYEHLLEAQISMHADGMQTAINLTYTNRDDVSVEEIAEEGFTGADDQSYESKLPLAWTNYLLELYQNENISLSKNNLEEVITITASNSSGHSAEFTGSKQWTYLLQTLYQGVLENKGLEAPLVIRYKELIAGTKQDCTLTYHFSTLQITLQNGQEDLLIQGLPKWTEAQLLMQTIFSIEYASPLSSNENISVKEGILLDPGEGQWYHWNAGMLKTNKGKALNAIRQKIFLMLQSSTD